MKSCMTLKMMRRTISTSEQVVSLSEEIILEGVEINLLGIRVSGSDVAAIFSDSVFRKFEINSEEIFPPDYDTKMLLSTLSIAPPERFYQLNINCGNNSKFEIVYKDGGWQGASYPYDISIYFRFEVWNLGQ